VRTSDTVYGMSVLDRGERTADRVAIDAMARTPGTRLAPDVAPERPGSPPPRLPAHLRRTTLELPAESVDEILSMFPAGRETAPSSQL
jgi:hypothetical protein